MFTPCMNPMIIFIECLRDFSAFIQLIDSFPLVQYHTGTISQPAALKVSMSLILDGTCFLFV